MLNPVFIIGCPRSGTTAYAKLLDHATNAKIHIELPPRLRIESRNLIKGELPDPEIVLRKAKHLHILRNEEESIIFGDKNPCYLPFIPYLTRIWNCKIIFLVRDGRDVVRSLLDWHKFKSYNVFSMREDDLESPKTEPSSDPWDYSRIRPNSDHALYSSWRQLSRFEKCSWYWTEFNTLAMEHLNKIDYASWRLVDVTHAGVEDIRKLYEFLNLEGFNKDFIQKQLSAKINSLKERTGVEGDTPHWTNWSERQTKKFEVYASELMSELNYRSVT